MEREELKVPELVGKFLASGPDLAASGKLDKRYVHKRHDGNVVIAEPVPLDAKAHLYRTRIVVDADHPFFFDHPLKHLPGMLLLEAVRQLGTASSHLFYNAPYDAQFILSEVAARFLAGARLDRLTLIDGLASEVEMKRGVLRRMKGTAYVHQDGQVLGTVTSAWLIVPDRVAGQLAKKFR